MAAWAGLEGIAADLALLQEAGRPEPGRVLGVVPDATGRWETALPGGRGLRRTAVVAQSDRVGLRPLATATLETGTSAVDWVW